MTETVQWTKHDKETAESYIEDSLTYLRHEERKSPAKINFHKKVIKREMVFLKSNFPDSYILADGYIDVDLT